MRRIINRLFLLVAVSVSAFADDVSTNPKNQTRTVEQSVVDYGTLYLHESRQPVEHPWYAGAAYGMELSNPYLNVSSLNLQVGRHLNRYLLIGAQAYRYFVSQSTLTQAVEQKMRSREISQVVAYPRDSFYGFVSIIPLAGRLNLFSATSLSFDLVGSIGGGIVRYFGSHPIASLVWSVEPRIMATERLGFGVSFGQEIEEPLSNENLARSEIKLGTFLRF